MRAPIVPRLQTLAFLTLAGTACSGSGGSEPGFSPTQGALVEKPGGGYFLSDPHFSGEASRLRLLDLSWGRQVDVFDVDALGRRNPVPVLRDVVIAETVISDGTSLVFETSPVTHASRLTILRPRDAPDTGNGTFASILRRATALSPVLPKSDGGNAIPPLSVVARDATLVLRFDDLLEDGPEAALALAEHVRLTSGYPPKTPQPARIVFDPSHGGIAGGQFHSTRVLVDFAVSERDAAELPAFVPVNPAGLPASSPTSAQPNVSIHVPTRVDEASGRFGHLANLAGRGVELTGPSEAATGDLVRAFRSGNLDDANGGLMLDLVEPKVVGAWELVVEQARDAPLGLAGYEFVTRVRFQTPCQSAPISGDLLEIGGELYEVAELGVSLDPDGRLNELKLARQAEEPLAFPEALLGRASFLTTFRNTDLPASCWLTFGPPPSAPPFGGVDSQSFVRVRFSEPMDPDTFRAFDSFRLIRGATGGGLDLAEDLVVGRIGIGQDLQHFDFLPSLPLSNHEVQSYRCELKTGAAGVRDLSGRDLQATFQPASFEVRDEPIYRNGGVAMSFESEDELQLAGAPDFRGQVTLVEDGTVHPRSPRFALHVADKSQTIPGMMMPFALGVQTPLSPLGSKLQAVWRYVDFGFFLLDENFHNLDVVGAYWSPVAGRVNSDFYPEFEMRMAHSRWLPDETGSTSAGPRYPQSGLPPGPNLFQDNILGGIQTVVHPRGLGYRVLPLDLRITERGTPLFPFPWNRTGGVPTSFTWRDTTVPLRAAPLGAGIPMDVEFFEPNTGSVARANQVPTIGLPLLWEIRCYPSARGLGFNSFDILLPIPGFSTPNFRAFSTGGVDNAGVVQTIDPDNEPAPTGGYNPLSQPPGRPTPLSADNSLYVGAIDTVVRVSRMVTIWIDTGEFAPDFGEPLLEPRTHPGSARIVPEYRGASGFTGPVGNAPFDASKLDAYGDLREGAPILVGDGTWKGDLDDVDGSRFVQVRFTFHNDVEGSIAPVLDSFGVAYGE